MSCEQKHRNTLLLSPFVSPSVLCLSRFISLSDSVFVIYQSSFPLKKKKLPRCEKSKWVPANQHWDHTLNATPVLFGSILLSWPYVTSPVVGMCGDGDGRSVSRGERPHWGAVKLSAPGTTGLWSKAAWFMAYGLPHWGETVQFPYGDTADVAASGHASSCSVTVAHQKYPSNFLWMEIFGRYVFVRVCSKWSTSYCTLR